MPRTQARNRVGAPIRLAGAEFGQAFFMHIPKTAGKSFQEVLRQDSRLGSVLMLPHGPRLLPVLDRRAPRHAVVHGHVPYAVGSVLRQPVFLMTFLRQPVDRAVSFYEFIERRRDSEPRARRISARWRQRGIRSFVDVISKGDTGNLQTAFLGANHDVERLLASFRCGDVDGTAAYAAIRRQTRRSRDAETLDRAKARLEQLPFIGITEHFGASMRLFSHLAGLESVPGDVHQNAAPEPQRVARRVGYDDSVLEAAAQANRLDSELYDLAVALFRRRYEEAFGERLPSAAAARAST